MGIDIFPSYSSISSLGRQSNISRFILKTCMHFDISLMNKVFWNLCMLLNANIGGAIWIRMFFFAIQQIKLELSYLEI